MIFGFFEKIIIFSFWKLFGAPKTLLGPRNLIFVEVMLLKFLNQATVLDISRATYLCPSSIVIKSHQSSSIVINQLILGYGHIWTEVYMYIETDNGSR